MRHAAVAVGFITLLARLHAQETLPPIPDVVESAKISSVPILASDTTQGKIKPPLSQSGTAVLMIAPDGTYLVVTCEHVIALKDQFGRTTSYLPDIKILVSDTGGIAHPFSVTLEHADEGYDFAVLCIPVPQASVLKRGRFLFKTLTLSESKATKDLREGEPVLYVAYPMQIGVGERNSPVARVGTISQLPADSPMFLIDGFVQGGPGGNPVYVIRSDRKYLAGLARAFEVETSFYPPHSGFSIVTPMDPIIDFISRNFGNK